MAKMKGPDFKAILLNHGEKIGATLLALLGVTSLATASWTSCQETTQQLEEKAAATKRTWLASTWPEDRQKTFQDTPPVEAMARRMQESNDEIGKFATTRHWNDPINQVQEKKKTVLVAAAEFPESSLVIVPVVEKDDEKKPDDETEADTKDKGKDPKKSEGDSSDLEALFGQAAPQQGLNGESGLGGASDPSGLAGAAGAGSAMAGRGGKFGGGAGGLSSGLAGGQSGIPGGDSGSGSTMESTMMSRGAGMGMGMGSGLSEGAFDASALGVMSEKKVRSYAGVSVRYIIDIRKQAQQISSALSIPPEQALAMVDFSNLHIERQRAVPGADPWTGAWEPVSTDALSEILKKSLAFDMDIVNPMVVRSEIAMPLLRRAAGKWTPKDASHRMLEEFQLSEEEQEIMDRLTAKLNEEAEKMKAMLPPERAKRGGFSQHSVSMNALSQGMGMQMPGMPGAGAMGSMGSMGSMRMGTGMQMPGKGGSDMFNNVLDQVYSDVSGSGAGSAEGEGQGQGQANMSAKDKEEFKKKMNQKLAGGRLLLVRFMDFTADRGAAYRYRVRMELVNPNFAMPIDELVDPDTAAQPTVFSEWSAPTDAVHVPDSYRYYAEKVESRPRADEYAALAMYYEHDTAGTPVMATVRVPVGTRIGGKQAVDLVDLGKSKLEITEVELKSRDFLASVSEAPRVTQAEIPELKDFFRSLNGGKAIGDRITVVDSNGAIVSRFVGDKVDMGDREISRADDARLTSYVLKTYEDLRPEKAEEGRNPYDGEGSSGLSGSSSSMMDGMGGLESGAGAGMNFGGSMGRGSSSSRDASRRGGSRGRGSMGGGSGGTSKFRGGPQ